MLPAFVVALAFAVPTITPATESNPTAHAGSFAAMAAFGTALILVFEALNGESLKFRRWPSASIAIGSLLSAYLSMAAEDNSHPRDFFSITLPLLLLLGMAAVCFVALLAIVWMKDN